MRGKAFAFAIGFLFAATGPVCAQENPCSHSGGTQVKIAGLDMTQLRCQAFVWQQQAGQLTSEVVAMRAAAAVAQSDLEAMTKTANDLKEYWRNYIGADPATEPQAGTPSLAPYLPPGRAK